MLLKIVCWVEPSFEAAVVDNNFVLTFGTIWFTWSSKCSNKKARLVVLIVRLTAEKINSSVGNAQRFLLSAVQILDHYKA